MSIKSGQFQQPNKNIITNSSGELVVSSVISATTFYSGSTDLSDVFGSPGFADFKLITLSDTRDGDGYIQLEDGSPHIYTVDNGAFGSYPSSYFGFSAGTFNDFDVGANVGFGSLVLTGLKEGGSNGGFGHTALGYEAMAGLDGGLYSVGIGYRALANASNITGYTGYEIAIGPEAMLNYQSASAGGGRNVAIGQYVMQNFTRYYDDVYINDFNVAIGNQAMQNADSVENSFAIGAYCMQNLSGANQNFALGFFAMQNASDTYKNIAIGTSTMRYAVTRDQGDLDGDKNIALGDRAGESMSGSANVYIGGYAGSVNDGDSNIFIGKNPGRTITSASSTVIIGEGMTAPSPVSNVFAFGTDLVLAQSDSIIFNNDASMGLGTNAPQSQLHVTGDVRSDSSVSAQTFYSGSTDISDLIVQNTFLNGIENISGNTYGWGGPLTQDVAITSPNNDKQISLGTGADQLKGFFCITTGRTLLYSTNGGVAPVSSLEFIDGNTEISADVVSGKIKLIANSVEMPVILNLSSGGTDQVVVRNGSNVLEYLPASTLIGTFKEGTGANSITTTSGTNTSSGLHSFVANGNANTASGDYSHAEGYNTTASGNYSHSEGYSTLASGIYSHAEGSSASAITDFSHAEGYQTLASGEQSHAEGKSTTASGGYGSHAEGYNTTASNDAAHAEGVGTTASGLRSHAQNFNTTASGNGSHAGGISTTVAGVYSFAHSNGSEVESGSNDSAILGGTSNVLKSTANRSVILGGNAITGDTADTVYVPNFNLGLGYVDNVRNLTAGGSLTATTLDHIIAANISSAITISLPANPENGQSFIIKDTSGDAVNNNITINVVGGANNIDGALSDVINENYGSPRYVFNGIEYMIL